jgi:hypothetical protein
MVVLVLVLGVLIVVLVLVLALVVLLVVVVVVLVLVVLIVVLVLVLVLVLVVLCPVIGAPPDASAARLEECLVGDLLLDKRPSTANLTHVEFVPYPCINWHEARFAVAV